jgi:type II secretory pathway component PulF
MMNYDEFAFVNQQLAGMLKSGIPLEGALKQLCETMKAGALRHELEQLTASLAAGKPLVAALAERKLPPLYVRMITAGVAANDLPGVLTLLADYYQRLNLTITRLKGLMVYPLIVLLGALGLSVFINVGIRRLLNSSMEGVEHWFRFPDSFSIGLWFAPLVIGGVALAVLVALAAPPIRRELRWRLPGFREASLAQVATAAGMMLERGVPLPDSLALLETMEDHSQAGAEISAWRHRLAEGRRKFAEIALDGRVFPPLFVWLVASAGEDLAAGFKHAAGIYQARSNYRTETILYGALPVAILFLGFLIAGQIWPVMSGLANFLDVLGSPDIR